MILSLHPAHACCVRDPRLPGLTTRLFKVPKREIFDRSDFPDFYTIKSLRVGNFGVKIKKKFTNI